MSTSSRSATPGAPTRIEGCVAILEFNAMVFNNLPFSYSEYRTVAARQAGTTVLVVSRKRAGSTRRWGAPFALLNVWVIEIDDKGLIVCLRDYVNPVAIAAALGDAAEPFGG